MATKQAKEFLAGHPQLSEFVLTDVRQTGKKIGAGAYGSVEEVVIPGTVCAAKRLHDILQDRSEISQSEIERVSQQFVKECRLMSRLCHPNIIRFLGVCFFPGSRLPALVMERLLTGLHDLLDPEIDPRPPPNTPKAPIPLSLKCSILHDVAAGLTYLHGQSPPIIHRDLTARNILLDSKMMAKIVDLGVARIMPPTTSATMTKGPGASVYMPPEATAPAPSNTEKSKYNASIDIFSFGVVTIFTIGEVFPCDPKAHNVFNEETNMLEPLTELQRRGEYMKHVYTKLADYGQSQKGHPLITLIERCLHNAARMRPDIAEVLDLVEKAKSAAMDWGWQQKAQTRQANSSQISSPSSVSEVQANMEKLKLKEKETVELLKAELDSMRRDQQLMQDTKDVVKAKDEELAKLKELLKQKEDELRRSKSAVEGSPREKRTPTRAHTSGAINVSLSSSPVSTAVKPKKLSTRCVSKKQAPQRMLRGSATFDGHFSYFTPHESNSVYLYDHRKDTWSSDIASCIARDSGLAMVGGDLISVGGGAGYGRTRKVHVLKRRKWVENPKYPPLPTARSSPAVVVTPSGEFVLVIGGFTTCWTSTVDVFQTTTNKWCKFPYLPQPLQAPSAALCGDVLHAIGYDTIGFSCSLQPLLSTTSRPITTDHIPKLVAWQPLPTLPVTHSTAANLSDQLVLVGGRKGAPVSTIHQLFLGEWVEVEDMLGERERCLVINSAPNKILIVSGVKAWANVEECEAT